MEIERVDFTAEKTDSDRQSSYPINFRKSLVLTLMLFNLACLFAPRLDFEIREPVATSIRIDVENIPVTRQARRAPPPPKPTVPIPSDDETIPEDVTIEETTLKERVYDLVEGNPEVGGAHITPPRLVGPVAPEMPKDEYKHGVQGIVKLSVHVDNKGRVTEVVVLDNTTSSEKCARAAIEAAYGSRYFPAREGRRMVEAWSFITYRFDSHN